MENLVKKDQLLERIGELDECQIAERSPALIRLFSHRSIEVRQEVAKALGRAGVGESALIDQLGLEKNELVVTDLCDALGDQRSENAVAPLKLVAQNHSSGLARRYAVEALLDILWEEAIPFFKRLRESERSHRVRSKLNVALFVAGDDDSLDAMLNGLFSKDYIVRCSISNLLRAYRPRRYRSKILEALKSALTREWTVAARSSLVRVIAEFSKE